MTRSARDNGAYLCAPKELARAEAHVAFTYAELDAGHYLRARQHLDEADRNAHLAYQNSPRERCARRASSSQDADGDGCLDDVDRCPTAAEDEDGFHDEDCCPDPDNDRDLVCDPTPDIQSVIDKWTGTCAGSDKCPAEAEDRDSFADEDGCPDPDNDQDGLLDTADRCPLQPEDKDGFEDDDGCPDPDNDQDQIVDTLDKCPDQAEDYDGDQDSDGCPDLYKHLVVRADKLDIKQKVFFRHNKWEIDPRSFSLLNEVAQVLKDSPVMKLRVEGHTDSRGKERYNLTLSQKRADSVRNYLIRQGIEGGRLQARGFGETQPIASNQSKRGREQNRRVEFIITEK